MVALNSYLETWNSRVPALWAASLHYPHVRPGPGEFAVSRTPEKNTRRASTTSRRWPQAGTTASGCLVKCFRLAWIKVHVAGSWRRYTEDGRPLASSAITYVVTDYDGRWAVQSRFAAGAGGVDAPTAAAKSAAALDAVRAFLQAWNSHDPKMLAGSLHDPHVRLADGLVEDAGTPRISFSRDLNRDVSERGTKHDSTN